MTHPSFGTQVWRGRTCNPPRRNVSASRTCSRVFELRRWRSTNPKPWHREPARASRYSPSTKRRGAVGLSLAATSLTSRNRRMWQRRPPSSSAFQDKAPMRSRCVSFRRRGCSTSSPIATASSWCTATACPRPTILREERRFELGVAGVWLAQPGHGRRRRSVALLPRVAEADRSAPRPHRGRAGESRCVPTSAAGDPRAKAR